MNVDTGFQQQTIGVLGGLSNIATAEYYRLLNAFAMEQAGDPDIAETLIAGTNFGNIERWLKSSNWPALEAYFEKNIDRLLAGGADFIICASNTCHKTFDAVLARRDFPHLHIADATADAIKAAGLDRVSLFGTRYTMELPFLKDRLWQRHGITCLIPNEEERTQIDRIIYEELCKNVFTEESRQVYLAASDRLRDEEGSQGLILGCTEIGQLIFQRDRPDHPMFDTTALHCRAAVTRAMGGNMLDQAA